MRAKEWLVVSGAVPVRTVWDKLAAAIDDRHVARIVDVLKIVPEQKIAAFGSGEGSFIFPLAEQEGETGIAYAVDINPKALRRVERLAQKRGEVQCLASRF